MLLSSVASFKYIKEPERQKKGYVSYRRNTIQSAIIHRLPDNNNNTHTHTETETNFEAALGNSSSKMSADKYVQFVGLTK